MAEHLFESHTSPKPCQISAENNTASVGNRRCGTILIEELLSPFSLHVH